MKPIRTAIVGAGLMGYWHGETVRRLGGQVVAVADTQVEAAGRLAERHRAKVFTDAQEMLDGADFDVWHVCTPLESHVGLLEMGLPAGKHTLIEKPLTPTTETTQHAYQLAEKHNVLLCPVHQFPFQRGVAQAKNWLAEIGQMVSFHYTVHSAGGEGQADNVREQIAIDIFPHAFSLIHAFLPVRVDGLDWQVSHADMGEWFVYTVEQGVQLNIRVSMNARPTTNHCLIIGTNGTIHIDLFHGYAFKESGAVSRNRKILHPFEQSWQRFSRAGQNLVRRAIRHEPAYPGLRELCQQFYSTVAGQAELSISPSEAISIAKARDMIVRYL